MSDRIKTFLLTALAVATSFVSTSAQTTLTAKANFSTPSVVESDRIRDGLVGPVRRVRTEIAKLSTESGKTVEGKHAVLEIVAYDIKGNKIENQYFPVAGANLTGKEVYKYDEKGNISEMTLLNADGSLLSKEVYKYEFDFAGNWNKMTTAVAMIDAGRMFFEPTEVTYRFIMYYLDENMMKLAQAGTQPPAANSSPAPAPANNASNAPLDNKTSALPTAAKNNSNAQKSPALPSASVTSDDLNKMNSAQLSGAPLQSNVAATSMKIDSEPPPPLPRPLLKPVSGGVLNGTALSLPAPLYPDVARRLRIAGTVVVEVVVDETGKVISAVATSGPQTLRLVAEQAALRARFSPTKLSGQPVKVSGFINYKFSLGQ